MKAWIARDEDGESRLLSHKPEWHELTDCWLGFSATMYPEEEVEALASRLGIEPGYCQPIELTATPVGEPERGGQQ